MFTAENNELYAHKFQNILDRNKIKKHNYPYRIWYWLCISLGFLKNSIYSSILKLLIIKIIGGMSYVTKGSLTSIISFLWHYVVIWNFYFQITKRGKKFKSTFSTWIDYMSPNYYLCSNGME